MRGLVSGTDKVDFVYLGMGTLVVGYFNHKGLNVSSVGHERWELRVYSSDFADEIGVIGRMASTLPLPSGRKRPAIASIFSRCGSV